jgi:hypothetical protein
MTVPPMVQIFDGKRRSHRVGNARPDQDHAHVLRAGRAVLRRARWSERAASGPSSAGSASSVARPWTPSQVLHPTGGALRLSGTSSSPMSRRQVSCVVGQPVPRQDLHLLGHSKGSLLTHDGGAALLSEGRIGEHQVEAVAGVGGQRVGYTMGSKSWLPMLCSSTAPWPAPAPSP